MVINLKLDQFARWCVFLSYIQQEVKRLTGIGILSDNKMNRASNKGVMNVDMDIGIGIDINIDTDGASQVLW